MNSILKKINSKTPASYFIALSSCILLLIFVMKLWSADLCVPFAYSGDGQLNGMCIKGIIDNGWFLSNKYIGMPTGLYMQDFPFPNNLDCGLIKLISYFTKSYGLTLNIFYLLTFPLTTFTSMLVFRQFKASYSSSIFGSLIYAFTSYHFSRGENHLFLSTYYLIPLVVMVILWTYEDNTIIFGKDGKFNVFNSKFLISAFICILMGLSFVYYAFFSCYFLMVFGIILFLSRKDIRSLFTSVFFVGLITLSTTVNALPTIIYQQKMGSNLAIYARYPQEAEIYGLKIIQLFLPTAAHRFSFLDNITSKYASTAPVCNENLTASLGIIGSVGCIFLLFWIFYRVSDNCTKSFELEQKFNALSVLNLSAILLGTIGGFSSIFSYFVYSQIRGYNRISIFISFFSIFAIVLLLDIVRAKFKKDINLKVLYCSFLILLLLGGVLDQTSPSITRSYSSNEKEFYNDENFIKEIEATMPQDTMIFQLPYISFPEYPPQNKMLDYDHFKGYLHSNSLRWSYGAMKGREVDYWQKLVASEPPEEMVETLSLAGFNGIYVDSYGYTDSGSELISNLSKTLMTDPLKSENRRLYFFDMTSYNSQLKSRLTAEEEFGKKIVSTSFFGEGFYSSEHDQDRCWRWSLNKSSLYLTNPYDHDINIHLETSFFTGYDKPSNIKVESEYFSDNFSANQSGYFYSKDFVMPPGILPIYVTCDAPEVYAPNDSRSMIFRVENFKIGKYLL
jgi:phosphoglycerol transferase